MHKLRKLIALLGVVAISSTLVVSTATAAEWYEPYMQNLVDVGVDFGDPGSNTTRCEWASGVVAWNGLEADMPAEATFLDVPESHDCYEAVETAYAHGVLSGYSDSEGDPTGYFGPGDPITREQAAKMIAEGEDLPVIEDSGIFPDESGFSQWAIDEWYHSTVYAWNKMVGDSDTGMFRPGDNINHAEAAKVITIEAELSASYVEDDTVPDDVVSEGDLLVELSDESPEGDTVPSNATSVEVAAWDFTAQDGDVVLDGLKVHTHGVTSLPTGHAVYLYQGNDRLTSGKSVNSSTNLANFTNLDLLINDGETVTLFLRVDVGTASSTSEMGFEIEGAVVDDVVHVDASGATVTGDFPLQGDTFGISTTAAGTLTIEKNGTIVNPQVGEDDVVIAKFKMSAATEAAELEQVGMLVTGTISNDAVENLELYVQGETDPIATVDGLNSKDIANFVLDTPYVISKGDTKAFTMKADFNTGRTDDTVKVYVDETTDVVAIGGTYGFGMAVDIDNASGYDGTTTACTSSAGTCSYSALEGGDITISSNGPSAADIATAGDDVHLLDFSIVSVSDITFKNFPVGFLASEDASDTTEGLLNSTTANFTDIKVTNVDTGETLLGPVDADTLTTTLGGSTAVSETTDAAQAYYLFTDEFDMESGEELNLAITCDVENTATLDGMTLVASLQLGTSYPEIRDVNNKVVTNSSSLVPASAITGKTMTVSSPSLVASLAAVPVAGSNTRIKGEHDVPFTGVSLKCGAASSCKVTDILLQGYLDDNGNASAFSATGQGADHSTYLNEYVGSAWLEDDAGEVIAAAQSVESDGDVQFSNMTWELDAGETAIFYVVGDISADAYKNSNAENIAFGIATAGDVDYEDDDGNSRDNTGTVNTTPTTYVTTSDGGSLTVSVDASTPNEDIVVAETAGQEVSKFKFTSTDEAFLVKKVSVNARQSNVTDATTLGDYDNNISAIKLTYTNSDGDEETKTGYLTNGTAQFSGMDFYVPADDDATLTVSANVSSIDLSEAAAGEYIDLNLAFDSFESVAQASGETYKVSKLDTAVADASDLDFGTISWTAALYDINEAANHTVETVGTSDTLTVDGGTYYFPVGTLLLADLSDDGTWTDTADSVFILTADHTTTSMTVTVIDDDDPVVADTTELWYALPGTGYMTNANRMHVYNTVPVIALASSSPSGSRTVNQDDTIFEFNITPDANDDVTIRQGKAGDDENDPVENTMDDAEAVISTTAGEFVDGSGGIVYTAATIADDDCFLLDEAYTAGTAEGALGSYKYMSFWIKATGGMSWDSFEVIGDDNNACASGGDDQIAASTSTLWTNGTATAGTAIIPTTWTLATVDISGLDTTNNTYVGFTVDIAGGSTDPIDTDVIYVDGVVLHNEMLVVDIAGNAVFDTTPSNGGDGDSIVACELYQGGVVKATAGAGVASSSSAKVLFVPQDNISGTDYTEIEIPKGVSTKFSLVCDTTDLVTISVNDDLLTPSIDYGSSSDGTVTRGDFWWSADEATRTMVYWLGDVGTKLSGNTLKY